jgi:hypothetical protein
VAIVGIAIATDGAGLELEGFAVGGEEASAEVPEEITGFTRHGLNSVISHDAHGVSNRAILDAIRNPLKIVREVDSAGRVSYSFVGKDALISLNSKGQVITGWARSVGGRRY